MARPTPFLIQAIRSTAQSLAGDTKYQWGHMGSCNCGHLAQAITKLNANEIHERAMQKYGDWNDQLNDYCPTSGLLMDDLITHMLEAGLDRNDLCHLERLSDPQVLAKLPVSKRYLRHNVKDDVVLYLHLWASKLEEDWASRYTMPDLTTQTGINVEKAQPGYHSSIL